MSRRTMSIAIPDELRGYIDERVRSGEYGNSSEYLRELIRRDRRDQAAVRLGALIADGIESGEGRELDELRVDELRGRALDPDA